VSDRRTFGPVMLLGLATAGLSAVAGNQRWASGDPGTGVAYADLSEGAQVPLAPALSLALLAIWGLLLVLRGQARRRIAMFAILVALAALVTVIAGRSALINHYDVVFTQMGVDDYSVTFTGWYWLAMALSALAVLAAALAVTYAASWPEMGSRYDAPGAAGTLAEPETPLEIWKAIDEGRDPTA